MSARPATPALACGDADVLSFDVFDTILLRGLRIRTAAFRVDRPRKRARSGARGFLAFAGASAALSPRRAIGRLPRPGGRQPQRRRQARRSPSAAGRPARLAGRGHPDPARRRLPPSADFRRQRGPCRRVARSPESRQADHRHQRHLLFRGRSAPFARGHAGSRSVRRDLCQFGLERDQEERELFARVLQAENVRRARCSIGATTVAPTRIMAAANGLRVHWAPRLALVHLRRRFDAAAWRAAHWTPRWRLA